MRIALDAMGTDNNPTPDVIGGLLASQERPDVKLVLIGDQRRIEAAAQAQSGGLGKIEVIHADIAVDMHDKPSEVIKGKPGSSMHVGLKLLEDNAVDAFVTMGNTGAAHAIATLHAPRRIRGVKRPALSGIFSVEGRPKIFLDIGANSDCKADWLAQFAVMGSVYASSVLGYASPRVCLLSNGEEEGKGNDLVRETAKLLKRSSLNYVGNAEPKEIFMKDVADVIVSDGFSGNLLMKTFEATTRYLSSTIRTEIKAGLLSSIGGLLIKGSMNRVKGLFDTSTVGGAPLLGVQGVVIIGHGSSTEIGVKNAVHQAVKAVEGQAVSKMTQQLAQFVTES
jgi:glycerol-3-phosphate acyltransferase PlsX